MVRGARPATADPERREHGLFGKHGEPGARGQDAHLARETEPPAPLARSARVLAQRRALDAHRIELLDRLDWLQRGHVALGPRPHGVVAVAAVIRAGAAGRVLVEDEGLAGQWIRPADIAVVAAALEVAGDTSAEGLGERPH